MNLLDNHLEQISLSSAAIVELAFPPPKIFTNALLHSHDITALIRDTESHERALFTSTLKNRPGDDIPRRKTVHGLDTTYDFLTNGSTLLKAPKQDSALASLLGDEIGAELKKGGDDGKDRGEVNVNILLKGAERLCGVYPIPGAPERIASLRARYEKLSTSIAHYESRVSKQTGQLARINKSKDDDDIDDLDKDVEMDLPADGDFQATLENIKREEEEIRELEKKKRELEDRVNGMERDLGGLLR